MRLLGSFLIYTTLSLSLSAENWPAWRGPNGDGTSLEPRPPIKWSPTDNIAWKTALPGKGHSSPIIWEDTVLLTSFLPESNERVLLCFDRRTGANVWQRTVLEAPPESIHRLNSRASGTPTTDGTRVFVTFLRPTGDEVVAPNVSSNRLITAGRMVVAAYSLTGERLWVTEPGDFVSAHGYNACPVLYEDLVIINGDHDGDAYIVALEQDTGAERWRIARENKTRSYVTPIIRKIAGRTQMVLSGSHSVVSYNPDNGSAIWNIDGPTEQFVASMVDNGEYFFVTGGYPERHLLAIRPDGTGNVTDSHIAWRTKRGAGYVPSPIVVGPYLLLVADSGIASCFDAKSGKRHWMERLPGGHSASPISAAGKVYFVSDRGITTILQPNAEYTVLAQNELGERVSASPAISQRNLFIRGERHLFCIGPSPESTDD